MPSTTKPQTSYNKPGAGIRTQAAEAQLLCAAALCLLYGRLDESATGTVALSLRINCQPVESQHMIVRWERYRLTELRVADDDTFNLGDEHVLRSRPLREERGADWRGRAGRDVSGPRGSVHPSENGVVLRTGLSNRQHRDRMPQRTRDHQGSRLRRTIVERTSPRAWAVLASPPHGNTETEVGR